MKALRFLLAVVACAAVANMRDLLGVSAHHRLGLRERRRIAAHHDG